MGDAVQVDASASRVSKNSENSEPLGTHTNMDIELREYGEEPCG